MYAYGGQVRNGVELRVVAFALNAVEFQFGHVAAHVVRSHVAHVPESARHFYVHRGHHIVGRLVLYYVQWHRVGKVGIVRSFEHAERKALRPVAARGKGNAFYNVLLSEVEPEPRVASVVRGKERAHVAVECVGLVVHRGRHGIIVIVVHGIGRTDYRTFKFLYLRLQCRCDKKRYGCK